MTAPSGRYHRFQLLLAVGRQHDVGRDHDLAPWQRHRRRLLALHEAVHRALTPKLNVLRHVRVEGRAKSYDRSSLSMYLEEALAESFAQVSVNGARGLFTGVTFPVRYGYVSLFTKYAVQDGVVMPVVPEIAGLFLGSVNARGWIWDMHFANSVSR